MSASHDIQLLLKLFIRDTKYAFDRHKLNSIEILIKNKVSVRMTKIIKKNYIIIKVILKLKPKF